MNKLKIIISSAYAATVTVVFIAGIVIWAELSAPLKAWLANFSGHHWTSKSIFSVLIYLVLTIVLYLSPNNPGEHHLKRSLGLLLASAVLGTVVFALFFTGHHFKVF